MIGNAQHVESVKIVVTVNLKRRNNMTKAYITPEAKQKLDIYVELVNGEVSGLGRVEVWKDNFYIEDIYLLKQESSGAETILEPEAVAVFMNDIIAAEDVAPEEIKLAWHSHANMGVFWSRQDDETARVFGNGWMLNLVVNKKGEHKCRLSVYEPVLILQDNLALEIFYPAPSQELIESLKEEVKLKVKEKKFTAIGGGYNRDYEKNASGNFRLGNQEYKQDVDGVWRWLPAEETWEAQEKMTSVNDDEWDYEGYSEYAHYMRGW
jgi:hypothetical protein